MATHAKDDSLGLPGWLIVVSHALPAVCLLAYLVYRVPRLAEIYMEQGVQLPPLTNAVIRFSQFAASQWSVAPALLVLMLAVDTGGYVLVRRLGGRPAAATWSLLFLLAEALVLCALLIAVWLPMTGLIEKLAAAASVR